MDWKRELRESYRSVADLLAARLLTPTEADQLQSISGQYQIRVTRYYASLIRPEADCPIRKQALPALGEVDPDLPEWAVRKCEDLYGRKSPWVGDSIGDVRNLATTRLTHRYGNRAILHLSSMCAVYCRFCFRKEHLNEKSEALYSGSLDAAFDYLAGHAEVRELILTGGDPLSAGDDVLESLLERIAGMPHIRSVRFHSRMAVTLPSRLSEDLARTLGAEWPFKVSLVSHFNHSRELTPDAQAGLDRMARAGVRLLNQSVLLRGVNDTARDLEELFQGLYEAGVTPFYLHHPDCTPGTFHFRTSIEHGQRLMRELRGRVAGPALPHYVLDVPEGRGKIPLLDSEVRKLEEFFSGEAGGIRGALYEVPVPEVRAGLGGEKRFRYLDLYR